MVVSAEIPDAMNDPELYNIVQQFQIHPTNHLSVPYSRCNKQGVCTFGFPYEPQSTTTINEYGRVQYRRRRPCDSWVVSYIPLLSRSLQCHLHVDICFTVNVFMYLYKYLFKGPDHTNFHIMETDGISTNNTDEFHDYIHGRYLSSSEAVWRIFNYYFTHQWPTVKALRVYLPHQGLHQMYRHNNSASEGSQLLQYFARSSSSLFDNLTYSEYFTHYLFISFSCFDIHKYPQFWYEDYSRPDLQGLNIYSHIVIPRSHNKIICQLRTIPPKVGELYYLRILLLHKSSRSYKQIRTIHDIEYPTFQEAAKALGLFNDKNEATLALEEGIQLCFCPSQLQFLFAHLILDIPFPAIDLWNTFCTQLCSDCRKSPLHPINFDIGLIHIESILIAKGSSLRSLALPLPKQFAPTEYQQEHDVMVSQHSRLFTQHTSMLSSLTLSQHTIYDHIIKDCNSSNNNHHLYFVDGPAGRGKSFLLNTIICKLRSEQKIVMVVGTTALSVTLYAHGRTAYSAFGIPVKEVCTPYIYDY